MGFAKYNPRRAQGARRDAARREVAARGAPCWMCGYPISWSTPAGHPLAGEVDELVPVSRGGSPYDPANLAPAHRCCNEWRKAKPVAQVRAVQAAVAKAGGATDPQDFVRKARAVSRGLDLSKISSRPRPTTDW